VLNVCGALGCLVLVATLPWVAVVVGLGVFAIGVAGRAVVRVRDRPRG
jgi:APA family basic amino acid/polyamine antiporter